jgi:hypothetical protein
MQLHANAALSLTKRRLLVEPVVDAQWTVTEAAMAAEVSVRCARKWISRYRQDETWACEIAPRRPAQWPIAPMSAAWR